VARPRGSRDRSQGQGLLTILFTDLEGSTAMTQRLGDARAQEVVRAHNTIVRREIAARGGAEIKHTGDGLMATFPSASRAIAAAGAIQAASRAYNAEHPATAFNIAIGLNAGEPVAEDADVFGSAVQLAARTCAEARGGQILATNVVRELVLGKGVLFEDVGSSVLKGFNDPVHLYDVNASGMDEAEAAPARRRQRLVWIGAGFAVALMATLGAIAWYTARGDTGDPADAGATSPEVTEYRVSSSGKSQVDRLIGDCVSEDLVATGAQPAAVTGDLRGSSLSQYEGRFRLSESCDSISATSNTTYDFAESGSLIDFSRGFSRRDIGQIGPTDTTSSDLSTVGVLYGGTGNFSGVTGASACAATTLRDPQAELSSQSECVFRLAPASEHVAVTAVGVSDTLQVTTQLGAAGLSNGFKYLVVYRNNTTSDLVDAVISLRVPESVTLEATAFNGEAVSDAPLSWVLGTLAAGEVGSIEFRMELISSNEDSFSINPRIQAAGADIQQNEPSTLTVVR
jgi:class 3 adenylate cyclase